MAPQKASAQKFQAPTSWAGVTTVMFRNIPSRYTQQSLLTEIRSEGFQPDYFYLPMDFKKHANAGYAFLNFPRESEMGAFRKRFDGARLQIRSAKLLQVVPAAIQGYEANFAHMQHSAVLNHHDAEHGPLFMRDLDAGKAVAPAQASDGVYVLRDLPQMYTHELVALELLHHGCGLQVAWLDVPLDAQQLNQGYALLRFTDQKAAEQALAALQGASFALAPAALPMTLAPLDAPVPRAFAYPVAPASPVVEDLEIAPEVAPELEQMLRALAEMQAQLAEPLPKSRRFPGLDIAVDEKPGWGWADMPTCSTACETNRADATPLKRRMSNQSAITPPTRSTSVSSAGSSPELRPLAASPDAPFALPLLLPSPRSWAAIAQGC